MLEQFDGLHYDDFQLSRLIVSEGWHGAINNFDTSGYHRGGDFTARHCILTVATVLRFFTPYATSISKFQHGADLLRT
jgi:hypothetical protein